MYIHIYTCYYINLITNTHLPFSDSYIQTRCVVLVSTFFFVIGDDVVDRMTFTPDGRYADVRHRFS